MKKKIKASIIMALFVLTSILVPILSAGIVFAETTAEVQERLDLAAEKGLSDWVYDDGYLKESFYADKSFQDLEDLGVHKLIRSITEEEVDTRVALLRAGISMNTITAFRDMVQEDGHITAYFEVDGHVAYCVQHSRVTPGLGSPTGTPTESWNDNIRKVLYYGKYGPEDKGYTYVRTALAVSVANGDGNGEFGKQMLNEIASLPSPPASFHAWIVTTNGGATQSLGYWTMDSKGWLNLNKTSANPDITNNNSCYSLAGAEYGVYTDWGATNQVGTLYTDDWGNTNTVELNAGTYYVKGATRS